MDYLAANYEVSFVLSNNDICWINNCGYFILCFSTYSLITFSLANCPTVLMYYPLVQKWPPQSIFFISTCLAKISLPVIVFMIWTILCGDNTGTLWIKKCTWPSSVPISMNSISYLFEIPAHTAIRVLSTWPVKSFLLYFAGHTKWYNHNELLWLLMTRLLIS